MAVSRIALGPRTQVKMLGGTGADTGTASQQAAALRNPAPITAETPTNPLQQQAFDRTSNYESGLASGTNEEITRELGRARDEISVGMGKEGEAAISRGADPSLFRSRALESGKRDIHRLQGDLAGVALDKRAGALGLLTGAAGAAASEQRLSHFGSISSQLEAQRNADAHAETQSRLNDKPYDRLLQTMGAVSSGRISAGLFKGRGGVTTRSSSRGMG